jgi:hypothetical protein
MDAKATTATRGVGDARVARGVAEVKLIEKGFISN